VFGEGALAFPAENTYTVGNVALSPREPMSRFLVFPLLLVLVFSVFAQEEPAGVGTPLTPLLRDPRLLSQERERITYELQQIQRLLGVISPNDVQTMDVLKTQQTDLAKQLRDLTQQMQAERQSPGMLNVPEVLPGQVPPFAMRPGLSQSPGGELVVSPEQRLPPMPPTMPDMPGNMPRNGYQTPISAPYQIPPSSPVTPVPLPYPPIQSYPPTPAVPGQMPNWADQDRAWESGLWGPRLPKELTELKQSVESLRKEIADLKETNKALEAQIQLLIRNILLSERTKEGGN